MEDNIFLKEQKPITLDTYLQYSKDGRENLGDQLPVFVYRMLEFSLKEELRQRFGKDTQIEVFRSAGRKAGDYFARNFLNLELPMDEFVNELQTKMQEHGIGVLRIEDIDEESGRIILTVAEDADCSGLPILGETVCNYDEGFIAGILSLYSGRPYQAIEVDCWATGSVRDNSGDAIVAGGESIVTRGDAGSPTVDDDKMRSYWEAVMEQADECMYKQKSEHKHRAGGGQERR